MMARKPATIALVFIALRTVASAATPIDFESPAYAAGNLASVTTGLVDKPFNGQQGWSESSSSGPGTIYAAAASGEFAAGQAVRSASALTYIGAKRDYTLLQNGSSTFTFDFLQQGETYVGFWDDGDGDGLFDQAEGQIMIGAVSGTSGNYFGFRAVGFGARTASSVVATPGQWFRVVVTFGVPDINGDRQMTLRARNLTLGVEMDFDPATPGSQPWVTNVTSAQLGVAPENCDGTAIRITGTGAIDNINGPVPPVPTAEAAWSGLGTDANWATAANWAGNAVPATGSLLNFGDSPQFVLVNNLAAGFQAGGLRFGSLAATYEISGNALNLTGPILNESTSSQVIATPLALAATTQLTTAGPVYLDGVISGPGGLVKSGGGDLTITAASTFAGPLTVNQGNIHVSGDHSAATGGFAVSNASNCTLNLYENAAVASGAEVRLGVAEAVGTSSAVMNVDGTLTNAGTLSLLRGSTMNVRGTVTQSGPVRIAGVGGYGANLEVLEGGIFNYSGTAPLVFAAGTNNAGRGRIRLSGGKLVTGSAFDDQSTGTFFGNLEFDGGTLELSAEVPALATDITVTVIGGGGTIDTAGHTATIAVPVTGAGQLTKAGAGTLVCSVAPAVTGGIAVTGGTLRLDQAGIGDTVPVSISSGAALNLNFSGSDVVGALDLGSGPLPPNTYNAANLPGVITGTGSLVVGAQGFSTWALTSGLTGGPTADSDGDGLDDAVEYVVGGDPKAATPNPLAMTGDASTVTFRFVRDRDSVTPDTAVTVEIGTTLGDWPQVFAIPAATDPAVPEVTVTDNGNGTDTVAVTVPRGSNPHLFARLRITITP